MKPFVLSIGIFSANIWHKIFFEKESCVNKCGNYAFGSHSKVAGKYRCYLNSSKIFKLILVSNKFLVNWIKNEILISIAHNNIKQCRNNRNW